jgi:hypothetical protein
MGARQTRRYHAQLVALDQTRWDRVLAFSLGSQFTKTVKQKEPRIQTLVSTQVRHPETPSTAEKRRGPQRKKKTEK